MQPVMLANVIDETSVLWRSVGLQLFLNHKNLLVDSDGETEDGVREGLGPAPCGPGYINETCTRWRETEAALQKPFIYEIIMNAQLIHGFSLPCVSNTLS